MIDNYSAIKKEWTTDTRPEGCQTPKGTYFIISFVWYSVKGKTESPENRLVITEGGERGNGRSRGWGQGVYGWWSSLYLDYGGGNKTTWNFKTHRTAY